MIGNSSVAEDILSREPVNDPRYWTFTANESLVGSTLDNKLSSIPEVSVPVLGTFSGIFAGLDTTSANNRHYSRKFWTQVINSPQVREDLRKGTMIGIFEHPAVTNIYDQAGHPTASHPMNGAFVVKELDIVENHVVGLAYLLNTPLGKLLSTYFLAKDADGKPLIQLFISARGASRRYHPGKTPGVEEMDPNDYYLQAFDVVLHPGFKDAAVNMTSVFESENSCDDHDTQLIRKLESDMTNYSAEFTQLRSRIIRDLNLKSIS